jgi:site-specific DNA-methyltransferase (adenine-specific)
VNVAYNMDCMEAMRQMPDKAFSLAVVDPPYGIGINHNIGRRKGDKPSEYKKVTWDNSPPSAEYFQELRRVSVNQIIWGGNYFADRLPVSRCWLYWQKLMGGDFSDGELAWTSFDKVVKEFTYCNKYHGKIHPTQKPVALYKWLLRNYAKPGDKILDTHLGSGSSRIAAYDMGFDFTGYEIDPDYFKAQEERFARHAAQLNMFVDMEAEQ